MINPARIAVGEERTLDRVSLSESIFWYGELTSSTLYRTFNRNVDRLRCPQWDGSIVSEKIIGRRVQLG